METGQLQKDEDSYVAALQYMQNHDCSYEHAVQCLKSTLNNLPHEHGKHSPRNYQRDTAYDSKFESQFEESLVGNEEIVALTPKEMKQLQSYFRGNHQTEEQKTSSHKLCQFISTNFTKIKRKMGCLRYLNPKRCWKQLKSRKDKSKYKKIGNIEKSSTLQSSKSIHIKSDCWLDNKDDMFAEMMEEKAKNIMHFLTMHQELLAEVKSLSESGLRVNLPSRFKIDEAIRPFLLVKEESRENIAADLRSKIELCYEIVPLSSDKLKQVLEVEVNQINYALVMVNSFRQIQILNKLKTVTEQDMESSLNRYKRSLIKNAFVLAIKSGKSNIFEFTMTGQTNHHANHHEQTSSDQDNKYQEDINYNRSIIQQQDFLYQSMLNEHKFKQEKETIRKNSLNDLKSQRQKMKQQFKEQPVLSEKAFCFYFRTPTGSNIKRNFLKTDHFQQIYDWIECEDSIEFEDEQHRQFDLYEGYPPQMLTDSKSDHLQNVFASEEQCIRLIIRQK